VTFDDHHRLVVGRRLTDEFENGRSYYGMQGRALVLPRQATLRPDPSALAWHREHVFLG
jgi:putative restriction endonuclease